MAVAAPRRDRRWTIREADDGVGAVASKWSYTLPRRVGGCSRCRACRLKSGGAAAARPSPSSITLRVLSRQNHHTHNPAQCPSVPHYHRTSQSAPATTSATAPLTQNQAKSAAGCWAQLFRPHHRSPAAKRATQGPRLCLRPSQRVCLARRLRWLRLTNPSDDSDSSDDDFGPAPPPAGATSAGDHHDAPAPPATSAFDTDEQYSESAKKVERDAWMTMPPTQDDLARMDPTKIRAASSTLARAREAAAQTAWAYGLRRPSRSSSGCGTKPWASQQHQIRHRPRSRGGARKRKRGCAS